jgi:hypothetical protein
MSLKYTLESLSWVKALFSPFKPFTIKFYAGKTKIGIPYFLPRKWVPFTREDALEKATKVSQMSSSIYFCKDPNTIVDEFMKYTKKAVPLKVGFSYCSLGWKTKWTNTDFRHEWTPIFSFVFFGYQIAAIVSQKDSSHYWEAWLYYEYATDKTKSKRERVEQCRKEAPQTWTSHKHDEEPVTTDYYERILKSKYLANK